LWKVIEERESWNEGPGGEAVPAIELRLWNEQKSTSQGKGDTQYITFTPSSPPFSTDWEIIYDW
jgi:hypothetical protein